MVSTPVGAADVPGDEEEELPPQAAASSPAAARTATEVKRLIVVALH